MKKYRQLTLGIIPGLCMAIMVIDAKTAVLGAKIGVDLCVQTVIPAIFPFVFVSMITNSYLPAVFSQLFKPLGRLCSIPKGCESILVVGLLGGYPVGAQSISTAYRNNGLCKADASRLLAFCSNAGPAFIFGMVSSLFSSMVISWTIWFIHILGAIIVGMLIPSKGTESPVIQTSKTIQPTEALEKAIYATAKICGWVILFRMILSFANHWFLWMLPIEYQVISTGLLELVNGCSALKEITLESKRFLLCSSFLAFGGLCVCMQTASVSEGLPVSYYIRGKLMHSIISTILAYFAHFMLFAKEQWCNIPFLFLAPGIASVFFLSGRISIKKGIAFRRKMMYTS